MKVQDFIHTNTFSLQTEPLIAIIGRARMREGVKPIQLTKLTPSWASVIEIFYFVL